MTEKSLVFPADEYRSRVTRLQQAMAAQDCDALLLTAPADVFYITGFLTRFWESPARPWFVFVPANGAPTALIPAIGHHLMARTWISDVRTWDAPDPVDDGVTLLTDHLAQYVPRRGRIGVPMGLETSLRMPLGDFERLRANLQPRSFVDATEIVQRTREIKSEAEIAKISETCTLADRAFQQVPEFVAREPRLDRIFRGFQSALLEAGADWVSYIAGAASEGGYSDVISPADPVPLSEGDVLMLDTGAVRDGYFCDFNRNYSAGPPTRLAQRTHDALYRATERALAELRPGQHASDVHRIMVGAIEDVGVKPCGGRFGHGLGLTLTEWPSFTPKDDTVLREGMVLTLEPSAYVSGDRFLVHEEDIVLRSDGAELLSPRAAASLPTITLKTRKA